MERTSELFSAVLRWASSQGAESIKDTVWVRKTQAANGLGPFKVRINGYTVEAEHLPPLHASIELEECLPGVVAIVGPWGGCIVSSREESESEAGLIAHFKDQTPPEQEKDKP